MTAMRRGGFLLAILTGLLAASVAAAQSVPMPRHAPSPRSAGAAPIPPAAVGPSRPGAQTAAVGGFNASQVALINRISTYLSSITTLVGNFVQVGPDGSRQQGYFYLSKPGRVRFEYDPPSPIAIIADGSSVVVRDQKLATQDLYPLSQTPLRYLLADRIDLLRDTHVTAVYSDDLFSTVVIEERQALIGTSRLMIMFSAKDLQLKQWTITDPQGFDTTVAVYNLDTTKRPDPNMFRITYEPFVK